MAHLLTPQQLSSLQTLFTAAGKQQAGTLSVSELTTVLHAAGETQLTELDSQDMMNAATSRHAAFCNFETFVHLMCSSFSPPTSAELSPACHQQLTSAFNALDVDNDGKLSVDDLLSAFASLGDNYERERIREMIAEVDSKGRDKIRLEDFIRIMQT